jgi:hypothetical protein
MIQLDIVIINIQFEYLDIYIVSNVGSSNLDTDRSKL